MKELISKITISGIIAVIITVSVMAYFFIASYGIFHASENINTQIIQVLSNIIVLVLGFYFGSSHKQKPDGQQ